ncbi:SHOCT domain-containing protein [Mycobacterium sp. Aquia_213]|uniref:SHOCT domain-containing protein n=1 Tax=Mycobacterium sp. Aquia_213 TaxID=2991728 RepID=UPI002270BA8E|nr:SHOCT domain-containing protein [Mycobacterium sp. Aquia_213]WAC89844.1 SHOCT domain-containing protein [Mycobacterium sp. Aquia_213]
MKATVTPDAAHAIADIAQRHGLSQEAVLSMLVALRAGGGTMAQFSIPELGGGGQWMRGGMTMVGDMFDNALKARVDALCNELAQLLATTAVFPPSTAHAEAGLFGSNNWWPADLGVPSSAGGQNDVRYAFFPGSRRLAIQIGGVTRVFDTGEHHIGGVQQQQGGGYGSVIFTSQLGTFGVSSLRDLGVQQAAHSSGATPPPAAAQAAAHPPQYQSQQQSGPPPQFVPEMPRSAPEAPPAKPPSAGSEDPATIVAAIESLAGLHQRGILSDEEFSTKKAELLGRL